MQAVGGWVGQQLEPISSSGPLITHNDTQLGRGSASDLIYSPRETLSWFVLVCVSDFIWCSQVRARPYT